MKKLLVITISILTLNSCVINTMSAQDIVIDQVEKSFDNISKIEVKGSFCGVDITSHSSTSVEFKGELKSNKARDDIKIKYDVNGTTLLVWIERPNNTWGSIGGNLNFIAPENTNITVNNSSGSVYVANIGQSIVDLSASSGSIHAENIDSDISVKTSSGSIKASAIGGNISARSSSGSQSLNKINGNVNTELSSGSLKIIDANGNVDGVTSSGSQYIEGIEGNVHARATSGSVKIENVNGDVNGKTSSGGIKLSNIKGALNLTSSSGGQYGTQITLTGNSSFNSSSGGIKMELTNNENELSFDLSASSGGLKAKSKNGSKRIVTGNGSIQITGRSSSGSQHYQ